MFRNILVSVDGSPHSHRALDEAIDIARAGRGRLTILTAVNHPPAWAASSIATGAAALSALDLEREAINVMSRAVALVPDDVPVTTLIVHADPEHAPREEAGQEPASSPRRPPESNGPAVVPA